MRANRRRDTKPELALRSELHRRGHRFRVDLPVQAGSRRVRPDLVFTRARVAVFIDGCFWHRCPEHGTMPKSNADYWKAKLDANVERDRTNTTALEGANWIVLRIWAHVPPAEGADMVQVCPHCAYRAQPRSTDKRPEETLRERPLGS